MNDDCHRTARVTFSRPATVSYFHAIKGGLQKYEIATELTKSSPAHGCCPFRPGLGIVRRPAPMHPSSDDLSRLARVSARVDGAKASRFADEAQNFCSTKANISEIEILGPGSIYARDGSFRLTKATGSRCEGGDRILHSSVNLTRSIADDSFVSSINPQTQQSCQGVRHYANAS